MNRLTKVVEEIEGSHISVDGDKVIQCSIWCDECRKAKCEYIQSALHRLAAYEDTGMTPRDIFNLQADYSAKGALLVEYKNTGLAPDEISDGIAKMLKAFNEYIEHGWIPVEEGLPDEPGAYIVSYLQCSGGNVINPSINAGIDVFNDKKVWSYNKFQKVIAWMPLPKPYKSEVKQQETQPSWKDAIMRTFLGGRV